MNEVAYPAHMLGDDPLLVRLRATYAKISAQVGRNAEEAAERRLALEWCRKNGNPHLEASNGR